MISTPKWLCLLDAEAQILCYDGEGENMAEIDLFCNEKYGILHLPKDYSADSLEKT